MNEKTKASIGVTLQSVFIVLGVYFFGRIIRNNYYYAYVSEPISAVYPVLGKILFYLGHTIFIILTLLYFAFVKEERYCLEHAKFTKDNKALPQLIIGIIIGFSINAAAVIMAIINGDIDMLPQKFDLGMLILMFIAVFIQSSSEELSVRILGFSRTLKKAGLGFALAGSSIAFGMEHLMNKGITLIAFTNIVLVGIFFAMSIYYFDNFYFACGYHTAWNFTQNSFFGLPNSGYPAEISVYAPSYTNKSIFYDPEFGIEGTLTVTVLNILLIAAMAFLIRKKNKV